MISEICEIGMLLAFGFSWPLNAMKAYRARTTKGTSLPFLLLILSGYVCGIISKSHRGAHCRRGDEGGRARGALDEVPACDFARAHDKPLSQGWARRQTQIPADCRRLRFIRWRHLLPFSLSAPTSLRKYRGWGLSCADKGLVSGYCLV